MKKRLLLQLFFSFTLLASKAQNTFPSSGSVGIGTNNPVVQLHINGPMIIGGGPSNVDRLHTNISYLANSMNMLIAWNRTAGEGEADFIANQGPGGIGGYAFYNYDNNGNENQLLRILGNGNLGIGTNNPLTKLHVEGVGFFNAPASTNTYTSSDMLANGYQLSIRDPSNAIHKSIAALQLNAFNSYGAIALDYTSTFNGDMMFGLNNNGYSVVERMRITSDGNVGIGTTAPDEKLTVYGNVHARGVRVDLNGPLADYVFAQDYHLPSLNKVKSYIKTYHHLSEMPTAHDAEVNGLNLGEMSQKLLKKVEELTLYLIEKDKKDESQQKQLNDLKHQVKAMHHILLNRR